MLESRTLGKASLQLFAQLKSQISFSDFCPPAGTIEFRANDGFLTNSLTLFKLTFPGFELEASVRDGMVFIRRNGQFQHSEQFKGREPYHVAFQWDIDHIACGVMPAGNQAELMIQHMRGVFTPITLPPQELVQTLRTENLLVNSAYRNPDDIFTCVIDCIHLCEADIRRHGGEKFVWEKEGDSFKPIAEPEISRLFASFLTAHGAARNFDVTCETIAGRGSVDFYVVAPTVGSGLAKIAIEAKKAESSKLTHGLQTQLPEYMARIGTSYGIYITYWLKSPHYPYPNQESYGQLESELLHPISRNPSIRTVGINLALAPPASRL